MRSISSGASTSRRALSESLRTGYSFRTVSIGRVQGPTLNFIVEKEVEVRTFVPTPYWTVRGRFRRGDATFEAKYSSVPVVPNQARCAEEVKRACEGREVSSRGHAEDVQPAASSSLQPGRPSEGGLQALWLRAAQDPADCREAVPRCHDLVSPDGKPKAAQDRLSDGSSLR